MFLATLKWNAQWEDDYLMRYAARYNVYKSPEGNVSPFTSFILHVNAESAGKYWALHFQRMAV